MKKIQILIMVGISGSGKSTYAKERMGIDPSYLRINRDDIRKTLVGDLTDYYTRNDLQEIETVVTQIENNIFWRSAIAGFNIIIDNTNLTEKYIARWLKNIEEFNNSNTQGHTMEYEFKIVELEVFLAKNRMVYRDNEIETELDYELAMRKAIYIDKQFAQLQSVKKYIETNHKDKTIE